MGSVTTSGVCASYAVTNNNIYQHNPVQSFTVTLSLAESNTRIGIAGITQTIVTVNDDDGEFKFDSISTFQATACSPDHST